MPATWGNRVAAFWHHVARALSANFCRSQLHFTITIDRDPAPACIPPRTSVRRFNLFQAVLVADPDWSRSKRMARLAVVPAG
jgi:hypothetical protein